jgi:predicted Zn-dependent protease with MMP-like domain
VSGGEARLDRGWRKLEAGDHAGAQRLVEAELRADPENPDGLVLLGACRRAQGDLEGALAAFAHAAQAAPEWSEPAFCMAEIYAQEMDSPAQALPHAAAALERAEEEDEFLEAIVLKADLEIQLGRIKAAQATLAELPAAEEVSLPAERALDLAYLFLEADLAQEAESRLRLLLERDAEDAEAWYALGLCAEQRGDEAGKRAAWLRVLELDRQAPLESPHLSEGEMAEVAEQALRELPERARRLITNVPILVVDSPAADEVEHGLDPRLLGLFEGTAYGDDSSVGGAPQVTRILLFRKNLERMALDADDLREQIRITLLHETGHFFGMSEADLTDVGLD